MEKLQEKLNEAIIRIAVLENGYDSVKDDIKTLKEDMKNIHQEIIKLNKVLENKFTELDKQKINELKTSRAMIIGIIISILTSIIVPFITGR
jgi:hypothetical protein